MRSTAAAILFLAGVLALPALASAQALGTVAGVVTRSGVKVDGVELGVGAVMPGVTVVLRKAPNETVRTTVTDFTGNYQIADVPPGVYTVRFTLAGFITQERDKVEVTAGSTATVNASLKVGQLFETFTVSGFAPGIIPRPGVRVVCGMTILPGDPSIDPKILRGFVQTGIKPSAGVFKPSICGAE